MTTIVFGLEIDFAEPRILEINSRILPQTYKFKFDGTVFTDSEMLHEALCQIDPGSSYSINFRHAK